jgi:PleD family two-component response regulator
MAASEARSLGHGCRVIFPSTDIAGAAKLAEKVRSEIEPLRFP